MWLELHIMRAVLCALVVGKRNCHLNSSYNSVEGSHFKVLRFTEQLEGFTTSWCFPLN